MPTTTPNMGLTVPIPQTAGQTGTGDTGPGYALNISNDFTNIIDPHDHSNGKGVQITPAGMNINADLNTQNNNLNNPRAVRFTSQPSAIVGVGDVSSIFVLTGDLWYVNSSGQQLQLTKGSSLLQGPTGPAATPNITSYFSAGVTGQTAGHCVNSGASFGHVRWNQPIYQAGVISQGTTAGTGAAWINIAAAGLYEFSYTISATGVTGTGNLLNDVTVSQYINGTGAGIGSQIAQSQAYLVDPYRNVQSGFYGNTVSNAFVAQLGSGVSVETVLTTSIGNGAIDIYLGKFNYLTIKRIG